MKLGVSVTVVFALLCWCSVAAAEPVATTSDYDCSDFGSQAEAQEHLAPGDPDGLDADSDGIACESNPCPCSASSDGGDGPSKPPPPPEPPKLSKAVAKSAAMSKARKFDRRNTKVRGVRFNGCTRRGKYRINCRFSAKGKVGSEITTCNLGVIVTGEGSNASARLTPSCRSYRQLEADRALAAMRAEGAVLAGKPTDVLGFRRHSLLIFVATARWTQTTAVNEECTVNLIAELQSDDSIDVRSRELECVPF